MGSKTFEGLWFISFSNDHAPPHVHGRYAGVQVIVELLDYGAVREASRSDAIRPPGGKRSDVRHVMDVAAAHHAELMELWETARGAAS